FFLELHKEVIIMQKEPEIIYVGPISYSKAIP
ncbi:hypothetical protein IGE_05464, partial [Bacillus cereus HuB1-1]